MRVKHNEVYLVVTHKGYQNSYSSIFKLFDFLMCHQFLIPIPTEDSESKLPFSPFVRAVIHGNICLCTGPTSQVYLEVSQMLGITQES